jgi:hypothetical protein
MTDFFERVAALRREGQSFAVATVVARRAPVSAHLGDRAIIFADGRMEGFVGGACSREIVRRQARESLNLRLGRLVSIRPDAVAVPESTPEHVVVPMTCASEGAIDVYIEPFVRARTLVVVGATPVAGAVARLARALEYDVVRVVDAREQSDLEPEAAALGMRVVALDALDALLLDRPARSRSSPRRGTTTRKPSAPFSRRGPRTSGWWRRGNAARRCAACSRRTERAASRRSGFPRAWTWELARRPKWRCPSWQRSSRCIPAARRPKRATLPRRFSRRRSRQLQSIRSAAWMSTSPARGTPRRSTGRLRLLLCELPQPLRQRPARLPAARDMTDAAAIRERFRERGFIVDEAFATALQIMLALEKPLLVEGPSGVGKTESAKVLADVLGTRLIRLQCYEGLDAMSALYEWNYPRQMLHARLSEGGGATLAEREAQISASRSCSSGRCSRRSCRIDRRCCWSTKSIGRTRRSRPSCSKCWPSGR